MITNQLHLCDTSDMVVVHRVFRREFRLLPQMVAAVRDGDVRRAAEIAGHAEDITSALHDHHHNEDVLLWPKLTERATPDHGIVQRMERQHERLAELLRETAQLLAPWRKTADSALAHQLSSALLAVSAALDEHLLDEETHLLPLAARYITADEWTQLGRSAIASMSKTKLLVFLGYILEEASLEERSLMLSKIPPPARLAFRLIGERRARSKTTHLRRDLRWLAHDSVKDRS